VLLPVTSACPPRSSVNAARHMPLFPFPLWTLLLVRDVDVADSLSCAAPEFPACARLSDSFDFPSVPRHHIQRHAQHNTTRTLYVNKINLQISDDVILLHKKAHVHPPTYSFHSCTVKFTSFLSFKHLHARVPYNSHTRSFRYFIQTDRQTIIHSLQPQLESLTQHKTSSTACNRQRGH